MQITIYYMIIYIFEALILWQYTRKVFVSRYRIFPELLSLFICYMALFGLQTLHISWLNLFGFFIINFLFILFLYKTTILSALINTSIVTIVMSIGELIVVNSLFHIAYDFYSQPYYFRNLVISSILNKLIYFIILQVIAYFWRQREKPRNYFDLGIILLVITSIISLFFILTLISICETVVLSTSMDHMITVSVILILVLNLIVFGFYNFSQKKNEEFTSLQLQLQKEEDHIQYQKLLLQEDENQKILIHDIRKHLQTIFTLNNKGESQKIDAYITEIIHSSDLQTTARICDDELLNSILGRYIRQCRKQQIDFRADIREKSISFLSDKDITSLFCNLMDNAMEAASNTHSSFIDLSVVYKESTSMTIVTLINSCWRNPFSEKTGKLKTTKQNQNRHGFGIKSIHHIVEKYNGNIKMYYDEESKTFHTVLTLYQNSSLSHID